jgi:hypothetical protein
VIRDREEPEPRFTLMDRRAAPLAADHGTVVPHPRRTRRRWYTSGAMKRLPKLPRYAGLCIQHRKVVGSDEYTSIWHWALFHAKAWRCPPPRVDETKVIRRLIDEHGGIDEVLGTK